MRLQYVRELHLQQSVLLYPIIIISPVTSITQIIPCTELNSQQLFSPALAKGIERGYREEPFCYKCYPDGASGWVSSEELDFSFSTLLSELLLLRM